MRGGAAASPMGAVRRGRRWRAACPTALWRHWQWWRRWRRRRRPAPSPPSSSGTESPLSATRSRAFGISSPIWSGWSMPARLATHRGRRRVGRRSFRAQQPASGGARDDIDEAREWRRRVTGHFEEFDNTLRRLENRIERLVADVDFRLTPWSRGRPARRAAQPSFLPERRLRLHPRTRSRPAPRIDRKTGTSLPRRPNRWAPYRR